MATRACRLSGRRTSAATRYEFIDNFSWIKGRHNIKLGGSIDMEEKAQNNSNPNNNGTFTFNGSATGDSLADFLIGRAFQYSENSAHVFGSSRWTNYSLYLQDQIRVNDRLNLTLGLRWEYFQPEQDNDGLFSIFLPSRFDRSKAAVVQPNGQIVPARRISAMASCSRARRRIRLGTLPSTRPTIRSRREEGSPTH